MAKREQWWVSKREMTIGGRLVAVGELVKPCGERNDAQLFGDNTHWTYRFDGSPCACDCHRLFASETALARHRLSAHAEERLKATQERVEEHIRREQQGETFMGYPVDKIVPGPRGPVPYIKTSL